MRSILVIGMHGLGDNLHQRAIIRDLVVDNDVWLETPWPNVYHDFPSVKFVPPATTLRTQIKNRDRNAGLFTAQRPPKDALVVRPWYPPERVRACGSVLKAMTHGFACGDDFRLPIPHLWKLKAEQWLSRWKPDRPLMMYRPLVERSEWGGCQNRNPDYASYSALYRAIRDRFFVISVADLVPKKEWQVGEGYDADVKLHSGELDFETIAALTAQSALVLCSPGFMAPLSQAVGTPLACVFGGYESGRSFSAGAKWAPYLPIEPIHPCECFSHTHACRKAIDMEAAIAKLLSFVESVG